MHALLLFTLAALSFVACSSNDAPAPTGHLAIDVAPLNLPDVVDVCYELAVENEAHEPVWSASDVCASRYGRDGDVSYIGTCDATDVDGDKIVSNTVTLHITDVLGRDASGATKTLDDWTNPCAPPYGDGCTLKAPCLANADTPVRFDLTVMRRASQGFFDVAVTFDDVFCSAKVDCTYPGPEGRPIELVFDPVSGERVQTVVWALACTDGDPRGTVPQTTHVYMNDVVLRCGATEARIGVPPLSWTLSKATERIMRLKEVNHGKPQATQVY